MQYKISSLFVQFSICKRYKHLYLDPLLGNHYMSLVMMENLFFCNRYARNPLNKMIIRDRNPQQFRGKFVHELLLSRGRCSVTR